MRLLLHIGSTKTGSSALQATLFAHRGELAAAGALYSARGVAAGAHHLLVSANHPGAWRMHLADLPEDRAAYFAATAAAIRAEAAACGAETIIISSEYYWGSQPLGVYAKVREAFPDAAFEVVAFVRRAEEWASSSYLQAVKSGERRPFGEYCRDVLLKPGSGLHAFRVINRWVKLLSARPHVLRYEETKDNVYRAFCAAAGLAVDTEVEVARVNPSPTAAGLAELLAVNRSDAADDEKARRRVQIMRQHRADAGAEPIMTEAERGLLLQAAERSEGLIARCFLGRS